MTVRSERPIRSVEELSSEDLTRLKQAHARLRRAVAACEPFRAGVLPADRDPIVHDATLMKAAYREVADAEADLWRLREELLGWHRPAWAPAASLVSDWFSEEDRVYDDEASQQR